MILGFAHTPYPAIRLLLASVSILCLPACTTGVGGGAVDPCDEPGAICTVAGNGMATFNGDLKPALETSLYNPLDVCFGADGLPLILDFSNWKLRRLNEDGTLEIVMGLDYEGPPIDGTLARETPLHHSSDIERDVEGNLYVAGNHSPVIFVVKPDDTVQTVAGGPVNYGYSGDGGPALEALMGLPFGVIPAADGTFYFSDNDYHVVRHVNNSGVITTVAGNGEPGYSGDGGFGPESRLYEPTRLRFDIEGFLYICDTGNHCIRMLDTNENIHTVMGTGESGYTGEGGPANEARFNKPYDIRFAPNGDAFIADTGNHAIRRVDADGVVTTVVGNGAAGFSGDEGPASSAQLNGPAGVTFDSRGNMWISDAYNNRVRKVARFLETVGGAGSSE